MVESGVKMSDTDLRNALDPKHVMMAYKNHGGTAPESTKKVLDNLA